MSKEKFIAADYDREVVQAYIDKMKREFDEQLSVRNMLYSEGALCKKGEESHEPTEEVATSEETQEI